MTKRKNARPDVTTIGASKDTTTGLSAAVQWGIHRYRTMEPSETQELLQSQQRIVGGDERW